MQLQMTTQMTAKTSTPDENPNDNLDENLMTTQIKTLSDNGMWQQEIKTQMNI
jgi:hypothetical protein